MNQRDSASAAEQSIEAAIAQLEPAIRQLKVQYDMFFAGALDREPVELRARLERLIKFHQDNPRGKYHQRFHFNALVSRFNSFSELWGKTVRQKEEGHGPNPAAGRGPEFREKLVARVRLAQTAGREDDLRKLYGRFVDAREKKDRSGRSPSFENFLRGISNQTDRLRKKSGCGEIELRLVVRDDKVELKARPCG